MKLIMENWRKYVREQNISAVDASISEAVDTTVDTLDTGLDALGLEEGQRGFCVRDSDGTIYPASESDGRTCRSKVDHSFSSRAAAESFVEENYEDED